MCRVTVSGVETQIGKVLIVGYGAVGRDRLDSSERFRPPFPDYRTQNLDILKKHQEPTVSTIYINVSSYWSP